MVRGTPERCSSANPASRFATNLDRHLPTVAWEHRNSAATAWLLLPWAPASTTPRSQRQARRALRTARPPRQCLLLLLRQDQRSLGTTTLCHAQPPSLRTPTRPLPPKFPHRRDLL